MRNSRSPFPMLVISLVTSVLLAAAQATATTLTGAVNGGVLQASADCPQGRCTSTLTVVPVAHLDDPTAAELTLLRNTYGNWTFADSAAASGTFNILQYDAFATPSRGGADFSVLYDDGQAQPRTNYSWVQIAYPHNWGSKGSQDFIDSSFTNFPFYSNYTPISLPTLVTPGTFFGNAIWLSRDFPQSRIQNPAAAGRLPAGDLLFVDEPFCLWSCIPPGDFSSITFDLYLASFTWNNLDGANAGGTVDIHDGMRWGVRLDVPEPPTLVLLIVVAAVVLLHRHRGSRGTLTSLDASSESLALRP